MVHSHTCAACVDVNVPLTGTKHCALTTKLFSRVFPMRIRINLGAYNQGLSGFILHSLSNNNKENVFLVVMCIKVSCDLLSRSSQAYRGSCYTPEMLGAAVTCALLINGCFLHNKAKWKEAVLQNITLLLTAY